MGGLPIVPLVALGLLFFATPIIVLVLVLTVLSLRGRVHRLEARLADFERRSRAHDPGTPVPVPPVVTLESPSPPTPVSATPRTEAGLGASTAAAAAAASESTASATAPEAPHESAAGAPSGAGSMDSRPARGVGQ